MVNMLELTQSQEAEKIMRVLSQDNAHAHANSHQPAMRRIDAAIDANSYINNSSVAKTAMQKRRNIPLGAVGGNHNLLDGGLMSGPTTIMDSSLTPNNY